MTDPATAYFFKKYYRNIIKWWFVVYNPDFRKIWPSKEEEETARQKELEEKARVIAGQTLKEALHGITLDELSIGQEVLKKVFYNTKD